MPLDSAYSPQIPQPHFSRRLNVLYDVSVLGFGQYEEAGRTGVYRVVENIAATLAASHLVDLSFSSSECLQMWAHAERFLPTDPRFQGVPLVGPGVAGNIYAQLNRLHRHLVRPALSTPLRVLRGTAKRAMAQIESRARPLSSRHFKDVDIFHSPYWALPPESKSNKKTRRFLTVHDVLSIVHPETGSDNGAFLKTILNSADKEDWVVCVSEFTKQELLSIHPQLDSAKVRVIPSAASSLFTRCTDASAIRKTRLKYGIPEGQYLLSVCTLERRKNMEQLVRCFAEVIKAQKIDDLHLVLVGSKSNATPRILELIKELAIAPGRIHLTGYVNDADLSPLYSDALAFIYPSLWEGFGLPPLEAMQCGVPVLSSRTSALPEVVGDAGILFHPQDSTAICDSIFKVYKDDLLRKTLSARSMARARQFSWESVVDRLVCLYYEATG